MRYILSLTLSFVLFSFLSCNKKENVLAANYEMTFKKDGISETLMPYYCAIQSQYGNPSQTEFFLSARSQDDKTHFAISFGVNGSITPGVYETNYGIGSYPVSADYYVNPGQSNERDYYIDNAPGKPEAHFTITITSIEENLVKGTFSANYLYDRNYDESIILTNGVFVAKRH